MNNAVTFIGYYGGDLTHARAAWTSTGGETPEKLTRIPELLKMLADNGHGTPFERSLLHFNVVCDQASHIHLLKHRIGVSINGESARYKEYTEDKYYIPDDWSKTDKNDLRYRSEQGFTVYHSMLAQDKLTGTMISRKRAKESSRYFLTMASQITLDVSFNFRSFIHFQKLRNSEHAQFEIRNIAEQMLQFVRVNTHGDFFHSLEAWNL